MVFNDRIKALRKVRGMKQTEVAAQCGMVVRAYQRLENEGAKPHYDNLLNLAILFDVSVDYLMGRTDDPRLHQLDE